MCSSDLVLYHAEGIIRQSEEHAAALFGAGRTVYSTEGSSLSIRAMLYLSLLYAKEQGRRPRILAGRNAHKSFLSAVALLDMDVDWLYPPEGEGVLCGQVAPDELEAYLSQAQELPVAVYVTSPDYLGNVADVSALSPICHRYSILLLVDNAHGAYLHFLKPSRHPMALGADLCCDSAHKTLPVLTGGGYLHISENAPKTVMEQVDRAMALFASTSPSYLILQSLDAVNPYLRYGYAEELADCVRRSELLKKKLGVYGYTLVGDEPLKLTLAPKSFGYTGIELAETLLDREIVCEFSDPDYLVMMLTPTLSAAQWEQMEQALLSVERRTPVDRLAPPVSHAERVLSIREAMLSPGAWLPLEQCKGKILADAALSCPPAIPLVVCGERIDDAEIRCMRYYGVTGCRVIES